MRLVEMWRQSKVVLSSGLLGSTTFDWHGLEEGLVRVQGPVGQDVLTGEPKLHGPLFKVAG